MKTEYLVFGLALILAIFSMSGDSVAGMLGVFVGTFAIVSLLGLGVLWVVRRFRSPGPAV